MSEFLDHSDLLTPSLGQARLKQAPYSVSTGVLVSFIGGPPAALAIGAINAYRLGRLRVDLLWQLPLLAAYVAVEFWLALAADGQQLQQWFTALLGSSAPGIQQKAMGLMICGLCSLVHRREQRTASIMGIARPDGRWLGAGLMLVGIVINVALRRMSP